MIKTIKNELTIMSKKAMGFFLTLSLLIGCLAGLTFNKNNARAADIDFSGKYKNGGYFISLSQYSEKSSYKKGEKCGTMTLTDKDGYTIMGGVSHGDIVFENTPMKKIAKNKYKVKEYGYQCVIKVKKKSISVKFTKKKGYWKVGKNGTYKLKKRYFS